MPHFESTAPPSPYKPNREIIERVTLPSASAQAPGGVSLQVTRSPHRNGNPDHYFYQAWFQWDGGTLRSSTVIHDEGTRESVCAFIEDLTHVDHDNLINTTLDKYDWKRHKTQD